jgi:hypothetical protein
MEASSAVLAVFLGLAGFAAGTRFKPQNKELIERIEEQREELAELLEGSKDRSKRFALLEKSLGETREQLQPIFALDLDGLNQALLVLRDQDENLSVRIDNCAPAAMIADELGGLRKRIGDTHNQLVALEDRLEASLKELAANEPGEESPPVAVVDDELRNWVSAEVGPRLEFLLAQIGDIAQVRQGVGDLEETMVRFATRLDQAEMALLEAQGLSFQGRAVMDGRPGPPTVRAAMDPQALLAQLRAKAGLMQNGDLSSSPVPPPQGL